MSGNFGIKKKKLKTENPVVTLNPSNVSVRLGDSVSFVANADNYNSVRWLRSFDGVYFSEISDIKNNESIILGPWELSEKDNKTWYKAVFENEKGSSVTTPCFLAIC